MKLKESIKELDKKKERERNKIINATIEAIIADLEIKSRSIMASNRDTKNFWQAAQLLRRIYNK